jgi:hypothetical protein
VVLEPPDKSTADNTTESNNRTVLLIPVHPYSAGRRMKGISRPCVP